MKLSDIFKITVVVWKKFSKQVKQKEVKLCHNIGSFFTSLKLLCYISVCLVSPPHTEPGLCLQLALKQLSPGVRVEPCSSAVLQFTVEEIGQLVPLLPNPCTPISSTRWQTEDLDGNKVLFQVGAT